MTTTTKAPDAWTDTKPGRDAVAERNTNIQAQRQQLVKELADAVKIAETQQAEQTRIVAAALKQYEATIKAARVASGELATLRGIANGVDHQHATRVGKLRRQLETSADPSIFALRKKFSEAYPSQPRHNETHGDAKARTARLKAAIAELDDLLLAAIPADELTARLKQIETRVGLQTKGQ